MAKSSITKQIEIKLFEYFFIKKSMRCGLEVECPKKISTKYNNANNYNNYNNKKDSYSWNGRCDFIAYKKNTFTFIEIKVSLSDFKSKCGHNFIGHKNYYAVPEDISDKVLPLIPKHIGLYVLMNNGELRCIKNAKKVKADYLDEPIKYREQTRYEMLKHNIITACNTRLYNLFNNINFYNE